MCYSCLIVPPDVLKLLSADQSLSHETRKKLDETIAIEPQIRKLPEQTRKLTVVKKGIASTTIIAAKTAVTVYDCFKGRIFQALQCRIPEPLAIQMRIKLTPSPVRLQISEALCEFVGGVWGGP